MLTMATEANSSVPRASTPGGATSPAAKAGSAREAALPLRLAVARGSLGIELNQPKQLGPIRVTELSFALPGLRYPVDLSKGVKQFRNRRGSLQRVVLRLHPEALAAWIAERLGESLGAPVLGVRVWSLAAPGAPPTGLGVGVFGDSWALAFDLEWYPQRSPRLLLSDARGAGLPVSAEQLALQMLDAAVRAAGTRVFRREGRALEIVDPAGVVALSILPDLGYRVPASDAVLWGALDVKDGELVAELDADAEPATPERGAIVAMELASSCRAADDLLAEGRVDEAREAYLEVLSAAPGHPAPARAVASIDARESDRAEGAWALLSEYGGAEIAAALAATILVRAGQREQASEVFVQAASQEPFGPLAALLLRQASELEGDARASSAHLDSAVARAPGLASVRWARFETRLRRGDYEGAVADAQFLEASARGARARHDVCLRVGRALAAAGQAPRARRFLERALRYAPDDGASCAALGRVFISLDMHARGAALLQAALRRSSDEPADAELLIDLAHLLVDPFGDVPGAIARLRQVSSRSPLAARARALEGKLCARIGDFTGASRAYASLREAVELSWLSGEEAARGLMEGAAFEEARGEHASAERHLYAALSLRPHEVELQQEFARVAALARGAASSEG